MNQIHDIIKIKSGLGDALLSHQPVFQKKDLLVLEGVTAQCSLMGVLRVSDVLQWIKLGWVVCVVSSKSIDLFFLSPKKHLWWYQISQSHQDVIIRDLKKHLTKQRAENRGTKKEQQKVSQTARKLFKRGDWR